MISCRKFMSEITGRFMSAPEFLKIASSYNYPLTLDSSNVMDFYISRGERFENTMIAVGFPSCFDIAEQFMESHLNVGLKKIHADKYVKDKLKSLNYRDLFIEVFGMIYVNQWELHTKFELGESQKLALVYLNKCDYVSDEALYINDHVYHTEILDIFTKQGKALKKKKDLTDDTSIDEYFIHFDSLDQESQNMTLALNQYYRSIGSGFIQPRENYYNVDTSFKTVGAILKKDIETV